MDRALGVPWRTGEHALPDDALATSQADQPRVGELLEQLRRIGPAVQETVAIPGTDRSVVIVRPADIDALLDHVVDDPEQNLPYWAELWPSGIALAAAIARSPGSVRGKRVLELGSGVGITAALAIEAGADLIAIDYAPESLLLTRLTCLRHTGQEPETRQLNWRAPLPASLAIPADGFPVVLAADVLYERRDIAPLLDLVERIVAPDGILWLAEPGRPPAAEFLELARANGWANNTKTWNGPWPDPKDAGVIVRVHVLRRELVAPGT
jgi:predicted nicotinamide N-methyase